MPRSSLWPHLCTLLIPCYTLQPSWTVSTCSHCFFPTVKCTTSSVGNAAILSLCLGVSNSPRVSPTLPLPLTPRISIPLITSQSKPSIISLPWSNVPVRALDSSEPEPWTTPHDNITLQFISEGFMLSSMFASWEAPKGRDSVSSYSKFCHQQPAQYLAESKCPELLFSHSVVSDSATPWTAACQPPLSSPISQTWLKLMSIESVMPSNHFNLYCLLLLLPSVFPSIRVFSSESALCIRWAKYWSLALAPVFQ